MMKKTFKKQTLLTLFSTFIVAIALWSSSTYVFSEVAPVFVNMNIGPNASIPGGTTQVSFNPGDIVSLPTPTRVGYEFLGWNPAIEDTPIYSSQNVTALWQAQNITVTFHLSGGNINGSDLHITRTFPVGTIFPSHEVPQDPVRAGFTFDGWSPNLVGTILNQNETVNAVWSQNNNLTVTFNLDGGNINGVTANVIRSIQPGTTFNNSDLPQNPVRPGFTFAGWSQDIVGTTINQNTTITARWIQGNAITVNFNLAGGNINGSTANVTRVIAQGQVFPNNEMPQNPVRPGFTFAGWSLDIVGSTINQNTTVNAQWVQGNAVTITFNLAGGNINGNTTNVTRVIGQGTIFPSNQLPQNPVRPGFTFTGWSIDIGGTYVSQNTTVNAQWTQGYNATVTFNLAGGNINGHTANVTRTVVIGQTLANTEMPPSPTREGYTFNGWSPNIAGTVITQNTNVNALWQPVSVQHPLVSSVVTLAANGSVLIGNTPLIYSQEAFGMYHITTAGVSVLPARLSLAILFGLTPQEALTSELLQWDASTSTFIVDPQGRNIRLTVGSYTMFVGGVAVPILSGAGENAFPVSVFVDPANGRMFLPTRAIADALGFTVGWNPDLAAVTLIPPTYY